MSEIHGVFVDITAVAVNRRCWAECSFLPVSTPTPTDLATTETRWLSNDLVRYAKCLVLIAMQTGEAVAGRHKLCDESISEQRRQQS